MDAISALRKFFQLESLLIKCSIFCDEKMYDQQSTFSLRLNHTYSYAKFVKLFIIALSGD